METISNEEKARQIAKKYETPCHGIGDCEFEAYQSAFEAMQWKDEQFEKEKQQLIDKACIWLYNWDAYRICLEGMKEVFVQKFKKSMEEEI